MSNVYTLKDIKNRGHRLGSAYEQELKKKLRTAIDFNSEIIDFNEKLQAENSEYSEWEGEFQQTYVDFKNKASQLITFNIKTYFWTKVSFWESTWAWSQIYCRNPIAQIRD